MSLQTNKTKQIIKYTIVSILVLLIAVFFGKVYFWENTYYKEKEGSHRETAKTNTTTNTTEEIIEVEPTAEEVIAHASTLPAEYPAYITFGDINQIGRTVVPIGTDLDGAVDTPNNVYQIGWYTGSSAPGFGGTGVYDGHNGGPNVFGVLKELPILCPEGEVGIREVPGEDGLGSRTCNGEGDIIDIETAGHVQYRYKIVENITVPLEESHEYMKKAMTTPVHGAESITVITCTGEWSELRGTYLSRQFTRAILVN